MNLLDSILKSVGGIVPIAAIAGGLPNGSVPLSIINDALGSIGV